MRCPECSKFVSYDEPQVEVTSTELSDTVVNVSARVVLNCAECGTELKDADIDAEFNFEHKCIVGKPDEDFKDGKDEQFEISDEGSAEGTNRMQDKDRNGKQIKSMRYMKTFYGFEVSPTVHCKKCGEDFEVPITGEEQASGFNECC